MISRKIKKIIGSISLLMSVALGVSCTDHIEPGFHKEGEVPIVLNVSGVYSPLPATRATAHPDLADVDTLPEGSTLRLLIIKSGKYEEILQRKVILFDDVDESCISKKEDGSQEIGFTYILQEDKDRSTGSQNTIPCTLIYDDNDVDNDHDVTEIIGIKTEMFPYSIPVTGETKTYHCVAISPAKKLIPEDVKDGNGNVLYSNVLKVTVRNQETFLSSNNNWSQTAISSFTVPATVSEEAIITLQPIMHTTARITITVYGGDFISSMQPASPLFEIDRVPTEPGDSWLVDKDDDKDQGEQDLFTNDVLNLCIGDNIKPQMGNNILYNRMYVSDDKAVQDSIPDASMIPGHIHVPYLPRIQAETTVLPMDARPTPMIIRLNLFVNDVPMQFQYQTSQKFEAGYSYDYSATINLHQNEVYIATWNDMSWKTDVYPEQKE